jgi:hypothetical protein
MPGTPSSLSLLRASRRQSLPGGATGFPTPEALRPPRCSKRSAAVSADFQIVCRLRFSTIPVSCWRCRRGHRRPDRGSNKTEIDLICLAMATRDAQVQRLALALAVTAITLCCGSMARAQVVTAFYPGPTVCQPLPAWYPRGWELMVRYPCVTYLYGPSYYPAAYSAYPGVYSYGRVSSHPVRRVHRRPYLRPGWWW